VVVKRFSCLALSPARSLLVYAKTREEAALKVARAGFTVGEVKPAGEYEPLLNIIQERSHVNGKANGHANGGQR
jgi:hypothetical protein